MYPAIRSYFEYLVRNTDPKFGIMYNQSIWGDWDAAFNRTVYVPVTAPICATANMMRIAQLLAMFAPMVGRAGDVPAYETLLDSSVAPFNSYYALNLANGTYKDGIEQTPALMALAIDFVPADNLAAVQNWLIHGVFLQGGVRNGVTSLPLVFASSFQMLKRQTMSI